MVGALPDWLGWWSSADYDVARAILQRGFGALYALGFWCVLRQFHPLLGEHGMLPVPAYVARTRWRQGPSLFRWRYSDRLLAACAWTGVVLAVSVVVGLPQAGPWWVPALVFLVMWWLYLSVVAVGQTFYAFGWETLLCEAGFLVAFLGSDAVGVPLLMVLAVRWLLFRIEHGAGLIKWRGDAAWRDLTALYYHHETQPLPGPFSWHAHHLPRWWHRFEVVGTHVSQLLVPWLLLLPQPFPSVAGLVFVLTQAWLVVTGNFAWLNWAAIILALGVISDSTWAWLGSLLGLPDGAAAASAAGSPAAPIPFVIVVTAVALLLLVLSVRPALNLASRRQKMNASFEPFRLVNAYGAFGSVTRRRDEVTVEGTLARRPGPDDWVEYEFRGKPGPTGRRPPQVAPYHLRLDWLMWFLPLGHDATWFRVFLRRLLEADPPTLRLLRRDPFGGQPPSAVRAVLHRYRYTTREERRRTGDWWVRERLRVAVDPVRLPGG
ncbi:lipase maturation factor [Promicromonospora sp. AC04]|uniref:lipase maturation factor family protein n=1 Tax=Promicromonospora sp. AC04 TaxID=2135723 RepID=UPI000D3BDC7C|nr:lipase maturation factor family protein [Promicromonospora sp. AC04]PUB23576.1 lipase maturation factor [Promicromonospora sp. AC04]